MFASFKPLNCIKVEKGEWPHERKEKVIEEARKQSDFFLALFKHWNGEEKPSSFLFPTSE